MPTLEELAASEPQDELAKLAASEPPTPAVSPERSLLQRFVNPPGHGRLGGFIGGVAGSALGLPGTMAGAFLGNTISQGASMTPEQAGLRPPGLNALTRKGGFQRPPTPTSDTPDYGAAAMDAGAQGVLGGAFKLAGGAAARLGFPRLAGILGAKPPLQAVVDSTPDAVKGVSTPALQAVDKAGMLGAPAAKETASLLSDQARRNAVLAIERGISENTTAPIQSRMASRVPGLADKTRDFADELLQRVPPEKFDKAFADTPSIAEAASSRPVMQARQAMIQDAVPQGTDAMALKLARRPLAAADARGVASGAANQSAADATGLRTLGGAVSPTESYATRMVNKVPGMGTAAQFLSGGGMLSGERVLQDTAGQLASRGGATINPAIAKLLSNSPAYKAATPLPQVIEDLLRRYGSR
jgi:hypothetical protein